MLITSWLIFVQTSKLYEKTIFPQTGVCAALPLFVFVSFAHTKTVSGINYY